MFLFGLRKRKETEKKCGCKCGAHNGASEGSCKCGAEDGACGCAAKAESGCGCGKNCSAAAEVTSEVGNTAVTSGPGQDGIAKIQVLGSGCKSCHALLDNAKLAAKEAGVMVEITFITDIETIMNYGVMSMPALVINDKVVVMGKVLKVPQLVELFKSYKQ